MTNIAIQPGPAYVRRIVDFPLSRILIAAFFVAVPFALVATLLNLFVADKSLHKAGALLLASTILVAYAGYVRWIENRAVSELSSRRGVREMGAGLAGGSLLCAMTIGI